MRMMLWLDVSQQHMLLGLNELDEMQLQIQHNIDFHRPIKNKLLMQKNEKIAQKAIC